MAAIKIDTHEFAEKYDHEPDCRHLGLWTFQIEDRDICFWGRYEEARNTAAQYATKQGLERCVIALVDCSGTRY